MLLSHITFTTAKITGTRHRTASHAVCLSVTSPQAEKAPAKWFLLPFCQRPVLRCYCCYCFSAVISVSFRPERRSPPFRPVSDRHCLPDQTQWVPALLGQSFHFRPESFICRNKVLSGRKEQPRPPALLLPLSIFPLPSLIYTKPLLDNSSIADLQPLINGL